MVSISPKSKWDFQYLGNSSYDLREEKKCLINSWTIKEDLGAQFPILKISSSCQLKISFAIKIIKIWAKRDF